MRKRFVFVFFVVVAAGSYAAGYMHASQGVEVAALGQALAETALCANGLNTLEENQERTVRLLDQRLRSALEYAEAHSDAISRYDIDVPNLVDGVERAKAYADRIGDSELSWRLAALHQKLTARS